MKLLVKNLDFNITDAELAQIFGKYGKLTEATIVRHTKGTKAGKSKGIAFVTFEKLERGVKAATALHGVLLNDRPLFIRPSMSKGPRS